MSAPAQSAPTSGQLRGFYGRGFSGTPPAGSFVMTGSLSRTLSHCCRPSARTTAPSFHELPALVERVGAAVADELGVASADLRPPALGSSSTVDAAAVIEERRLDLARRIFSRRSEARSEEARCSVNVHPAQQRRKPPVVHQVRGKSTHASSTYHEEHPDQTAVECEPKKAHVLLIKSATCSMVGAQGLEPWTR